MNPKKVSIDKTVILIIYFKYKEYVVPLITILVSILLFTQFVVPQFQAWLATRDEVAVNQQMVSVLSTNVSTISSLDSKKLDSNLQIAVAALPSEKDFAGVLTAISDAAGLAGVTLGDYSFQIGNIAGKDFKSQDGQLALQISLTLSGGLDDTKRFLVALQKQLPISDISEIGVRGSNTTGVNAYFYYNPFPQPNFHDTDPIKTLSSSQQTLLNSLAQGNQLQVIPVGTPSAIQNNKVSTSSASLQ